jgi:ABC-2 type transport system permease protein
MVGQGARLPDARTISASPRMITFVDAIGVLGVLVITSEYSTGSLQTSLAAVPRRGRFLAAKAAILTAVSLITGEATAFIAFLLG